MNRFHYFVDARGCDCKADIQLTRSLRNRNHAHVSTGYGGE